MDKTAFSKVALPLPRPVREAAIKRLAHPVQTETKTNCMGLRDVLVAESAKVGARPTLHPPNILPARYPGGNISL